MKVMTCAVVLAMAMASAAYAADQGAMKSTPDSAQTMQQPRSAVPAKKHAATMNTRSQNDAENKATAQLNEQQVARNGSMPATPGASQPGLTPQNAQNPNNCSPGMRDCAPSADGPAQSPGAGMPR